jgi:hypothetical protein
MVVVKKKNLPILLLGFPPRSLKLPGERDQQDIEIKNGYEYQVSGTDVTLALVGVSSATCSSLR